MFEKFTWFFLENEKITIVLITIISFFGAWAYMMLPKQYNPTIVAPAFNIQVPANWYASHEANQLIAKELENKIKELEWVDKIMSYSTDNFASTMVSFKVWLSQETAKTRLYDKIYGNYNLRPFGVTDVQIKSIDPEELPQVSLAITYSGNTLSDTDMGRYLRNIALQFKEEIKQVPNTTTLDIVWGYKDVLSVELDKEKIESHNLDIWQVVQVIQKSPIYKMAGNIDDSSSKTSLFLDGNINTTKDLEDLIISNMGWANIYLRDVATIKSGPINISSYYRFSTKENSKNTVLLGIAKAKGTNAVLVVNDVLSKIEDIKKVLPKNIEVQVIQNEWTTAQKATSELLFHLFVSIIIVLVILIIFLWLKNALNAAFCIPMVLGIVFIVWLILGFDINRITLFALILSLGILVDDSIVVVENNARHLAMMSRTGKTKKEAVLDSIKEVGISIVMSTITRVMSFVAMFAVTGMMGDYMKPIPIFASIALIASMFVAFSINPFLATKLCKWDSCGWHEEHKESKIIEIYSRILKRFIDDTPKTKKKRTKLKLLFWLWLWVTIILPIFFGIFQARMLPKADKNQIYVWIDAPRDYSIEKTNEIESKISAFLLNKTKAIPKELDIVEDVTSTIWDRFLGDFANLFRWGSNRVMQNQISMRINLVSNEERSIKSEQYTIKIRPLLKNYILSSYPDIKLRLLEDPPGPPTMATFHIKAKWQEDLSIDELTRFAESAEKMVKKIAPEEKLVDLSDTISAPQKKINIVLNHNDVLTRWLSVDQIYNTLWAIYNSFAVSFVHNKDRSLESSDIVVGFDKKATKDISFLKNMYFTNQKWEKVRLDEVARIENVASEPEIYTDNRATTINIFSELGNNSVVYPVLKLYDLFGSEEFEKMGYKKISATPYVIQFEGIKDKKQYRIEWGWEWEITMDTFRDLGIAMIISLLGIYFLIVAQFKSFKVGWIIMTTFLLSFFGIFPGFSLLYLIKGEYFTATAMIGAIALGGIVVWNAIILIDYIEQLVKEWKWLSYAVITGSKKRFVPVMLTSIAAIFGSFIITSDPVWSWLAWSIIWWLSASAILTLIFVPIFYFDFLIRDFAKESHDIQEQNILEHSKELYETPTH